MPAEIISASYVSGIREGRRILKQLTDAGFSRDYAIDHELCALELLLSAGFKPQQRDHFRGQYNFWKNQRKMGK